MTVDVDAHAQKKQTADVFKLMDFVFKMIDFALKMMNFVLKMMNLRPEEADS